MTQWMGSSSSARPGPRHRRPARRGSLVPGVLFGLAAAVLSVLGVPFGHAAFVAKIANGSNSAATAGYFTCAAAVSDTKAGAAYFAYPFGEGSGTTANDVSGSSNDGNYGRNGFFGSGATGITYGVANAVVCPRDHQTVVTLDGANGYIVGPATKVAGPPAFSLEVWFKTTSSQGKLIGFGSGRGTASTGPTLSSQYDRHLYIDSGGLLEFGVYPNQFQTIASPAPVTDGQWHYAVATLSAGNGMALYLDGLLVAANSKVTSAQGYDGYWRIGYDNLAGWPNAGSNYYFKGSLAWAAAYTYALSPAQVAAHYRAGT